jgi:glucosylceramidase
MGASDLARTHYSYDDLPAGQTDPSLEHFSIAHDEKDIIPLVLQAHRLNPQMKVMATPWSPPGWMKSSGAMIGGTLLPSMYDAFANYFVKYIQAYAKAGIPVDYVSLQNEPLYVPADYPGMSMDGPTQLVVLRDHVLPAFSRNQITTRLLVYDHNWDRPDYPDAVLSDPAIAASPLVAGTAWHGYGGTPAAMLATGEKFAGKGQYQTEHSGGTWVNDQVREDFVEIIQVMRNGGRAFVKWGLALDQNRGPHAGGCGTCTPLVTVNTSGALSYPIDFYTLGHFSRFVIPGARRVESTGAAGISTVAFLNPDGSKALVTFNDTPAGVTFQVRWGGRAFTTSLPGYAGATFTWTGIPGRDAAGPPVK